MAETLFELERAYDRADLAAVFRAFADALDADEPVELHTPETHLSVDVPARVVAELEAEHEDGEPPVTELEFELEWDDPDGSSVRVTDAPTAEADEALDSTADAERSTAEPASATMPADAVTDDEAATPTAADDGTAEGVGRRSRFEVYRDRADEWRWRLVHWNGNVIADSGEGYASRSNAERAARGVMRNAPTARIERRDGE